MEKIYKYQDLIVWQKAIELVVATYKLTKQFPREEVYGLTSQMR
ncbi:MAG TPA: four helix bundle protein, partial [Gammaproteobacteria bacterium]|nr:four helix bundle protein [Gammaproteobacteria bacterium]